jgi:hypothetical protein
MLLRAISREAIWSTRSGAFALTILAIRIMIGAVSAVVQAGDIRRNEADDAGPARLGTMLVFPTVGPAALS